MILFIILCFVFFLGLLGFYIPLKKKRPTLVRNKNSNVLLANTRPDLFDNLRREKERYLSLDSVVVWGRIRYNWYGIPITANFTTNYQIKTGYEKLIKYQFLGIHMYEETQKLSQGKGYVISRKNSWLGPRFDQAFTTTFLADSVFFPQIYKNKAVYKTKQISKNRIEIQLPDKSPEHNSKGRFEFKDGLPHQFTTKRFKPKDIGPKHPYRVKYANWKHVEGKKIPSKITSSWGNEIKKETIYSINGVAWNWKSIVDDNSQKDRT